MPELVTHSLCGYLLTRRWVRQSVSLVLIGSVLPDVLTRVPGYLMLMLTGEHGSRVYEGLRALHSPIPLLLVCMGIACLFEISHRVTVLRSLLLGAGSHLALDACQKAAGGRLFEPVGGNGVYRWLFPFSWCDFQIGLFWPEQSLYAIPPLLILSWLLWRRDRRAATRERH